MPKQTFTINDFSGGTNGYVDQLDIADNELAQCQGFKVESGLVSVLGDMKGAYTPSTNAGSGLIEPGYGLFAFSHDYRHDNALGSTNYFVILDEVRCDIYSSSASAWVDNAIDLGTAENDAGFAGAVRPCFFVADGALRVSPGNFAPKDSGGELNGSDSAATNYGGTATVTTLATIANHAVTGDTIVINGQEMVILATPATTTAYVARNMTGLFPSATVTGSAIFSVVETRWRGIVKRTNFEAVTAIGSFTEWYSSFANCRPPVAYNTSMDHDFTSPDYTYPFMVQHSGGNLTVDGELSPCVQVGYYADTTNSANGDATWDGAVINLYITALYDDVKQESQAHKFSTNITVAAATELGIYIAVHYSDDGSTYGLNKRSTGARLYYEDTTNDPGILFQLLEIDFTKGCKKAGAETYTPWLEKVANEVAESHDGGATATQRTTANTDAFIFADPPKAFTYEINTSYPPDVNTHARYKTAVISNRRLYVGNVYQSGKANGDRMISSPVNKFDILPEYGDYIIDVTQGDGDEIVKLEAYADRILQFKKRTLYIINVGGGLGEEFLESQHRNMGVENPSQTCMTEYGVAWVNAHGVFLYDGQNITDLTREKLHMTSTSRPTALNVTESLIPIIGYHPDNKWLVVHPESKVTDANDTEAWIHDFKNGSWVFSDEFTATDDKKTNMVWTPDNELVFGAGTVSGEAPNFFKYREPAEAGSQGILVFLTKEFNLNAPGVKKKLRSVYITFSAAADSKIEADLYYRHLTGKTVTEEQLVEAGTDGTSGNYYTNALGFKTTSGAVRTVELVPLTYVTNAYSFQLKLQNTDAGYPYAADFKLYDISFVYRPLGVR